MDVKSRILRVLRHQKEEPIGIRVLEIQAQIKREEHAAFLETLQQMEESGEIWRRKNSVVLSNSQGLVQAKIVSLNEKFGFAPTGTKEGEAPGHRPLAGHLSAGTLYAGSHARRSGAGKNPAAEKAG